MPVTPETSLYCGTICRPARAGGATARCGLCPLAAFYADRESPVPAVQEIAADELPEPYRRLLVHERDMTSTLQEFHGARTHLRVLQSRTRQGLYQREVVLALDGTNQPVEFGAITIELAPLPAPARQAVRMARRPLGGILIEHGVEFISRPKAFIRLESDAVINHALRLTPPATLYGRCNALVGADGRSIADIVEILPPVPNGVREWWSSGVMP